MLIALTGNYTYFNFLTIALCLLLFDDTLLRRLLPERWRGRFNPEPAPQPRYRRAIAILLAAVIVPFSAAQMGRQLIGLPLMAGAHVIDRSGAAACGQYLRPLRGDDHHPA